ncbi:Rho guanine nucleotide exchange factor 7 [Pteropus alecto]|uniref:Rho guanine nucleotide exchange factor 7 n=2 Tax=Laurasiatheria TaxID=314145 RepID=L5KUN4_PTEAL|nr:Rho guanine nucleotide exchange factor 7 [Pteropus alecto]
MNSAEQTVTWLITLGVLESPKKTISDPEGFLQASLKDGVVLCRLLERLLPGTIEKVYPEPRSESECLSNIREFLRGCGASLRLETFDANDLYQGQNFNKVLSSLVTLNKVTADIGLGSDSVCARPSSHRIKSFDSLGSQPSHSRTSKLFQGQYRSLDMTDNSNSQLVVRAKFNFQQTNEDELSFTKGDVIHVTRVEEGGWWEGTHNGRTGWFPSNYVREIKPSEKPVSPKSGTLKSPPKGLDTTAINKSYYNVVLQNILETENEYSKELQTVLSTYLRPLQTSEKLSSANTSYLMGNLEEICSFQQMLVQSLEECTKLPEAQQRVGGCFLNLMPQMKTLYLAYCANHPSAVNVLTEHSEELGEFMEIKGANSPGILVLTTGLSKPFMRLDKYPTLLKELERHMEDYHPDRQDIQKSMTAFKNLSAQCQDVRKRKELELQILTEAIRNWEGDDIKTLGNVIYMSQVMIQCAGSEEKNERYLLLFPNILLMLSASPRMSGFIYQGKLPTTGMTISKLEDSENHRNAFEISGSMIERILVSCNNQQDLHEWVDHLQKQTKVTSVSNPPIKPHSVPSHTLPSHSITPSSKHADSKPVPLTPAYHTLPHPSHHGTPHTTINWGPLEPPKTPKPWSLSCLRPAPPLRPSAALCYKECLQIVQASTGGDFIIGEENWSKSVKEAERARREKLPAFLQSYNTSAVGCHSADGSKYYEGFYESQCPIDFKLMLSIWQRKIKDLSKSPKTMKKLLPKRKPERKPSDEEFALRKSTAALEEDAQILKVIEAYCTSAKTRQTLNSTWQGTDLMHNHVLADDDQSSLDSLGRRSSLSRLEPSDLSEDSDYDSIWTAHSYRMGSTSRSRKESAPQVLLPEEEKIIVEETKSNGQTVIEEKSLVDTVYALKDEVQELRQDNKKMKKSLEEEQRARKDLEKLVRRVLKNMNDPAWDETNL